MVDFSISGAIDAVEKVSPKLAKIARSASSASDSMEEAGDAANQAGSSLGGLGSSAGVTSRVINTLSRSFDGMNDEVQQGLVNLKAIQGEMGATSVSAQGLSASLHGIQAEGIIDNDAFRESLEETFDISPGRRGLMEGNFGRTSGETLGDFADYMSGVFEDIDEGQIYQGVASSIPGLKSLESTIDEVGDESTETSGELSQLLFSLNSLIPASVASKLSLQQVAEELDDVEDEADSAKSAVKQLGLSMSVLGPTLSTVSANIGPFNVGLKNMIATVPLLIATIGPLISIFIALAAAVFAAVAAIGAFFAIGLLGFAQQLEDGFVGVNNTMEAMKAIFNGLRRAISEAVQPLRGVNFGGLSGIDFFLRVMQDLVRYIGIVSEILAELLEMDEVQSFFFRIEAAMLGTSNAGDDTISMLEGLRDVIEVVLPYITDFSVWFIENLPQGLSYTADISEDLLPVLSQFGLALLDLTTSLTKVGSSMINLVLPALSLLFHYIARVIDVLVWFGDTFDFIVEPMLAVIITLGAILMSVIKLINGLQTLLMLVAEVVSLFQPGFQAALITTLIAAGLLVGGILLIVKAIDVLINEGDILKSVIYAIAGSMMFLSGIAYFTEGSFLALGAAAKTLAGSFGIAELSTWGFVGSLSALQAVATGGIFVALVGIALGLKYIADNANMAAAVVVGAIALISAAFTALVVTVTTGLSVMTTALISTGVGAIVVAVGVILAALYNLAKGFDGFKNVALAAIAAVTLALVSSGWGILIVGIGLLIAGLTGKFDNFGKTASEAVDGVIDSVSNLYDKLSEQGHDILESIKPEKLLRNAWDSLVEMLSDVFSTMFGGFEDDIKNFIKSVNKLNDTINTIWNTVSQHPVARFYGELGAGDIGGAIGVAGEIGKRAVPGLTPNRPNTRRTRSGTVVNVNVEGGNNDMDAGKAHQIGKIAGNHVKQEIHRSGGNERSDTDVLTGPGPL